MPFSSRINVVYPLQSGRIVLRIDRFWDTNVEANAVSADGSRYEFLISSNKPYHYFKPCVVDDNGLHWSQGANYLTVLNGQAKDIYPHFFTDINGHVSNVLPVFSNVVNRNRLIRVYFPPGYEENTLKKYPVLYMHDGGNLFFPEESFLGHEWQIDETMDTLDKMSATDKVIVVGIYSEDRMEEFTAPGYYNYGRFLRDDLKPFVDGRFRTLTEPKNTAIMGSSLGGVVSLHAAWEMPDVFGKAACMSSTFNYRDDLLERIYTQEKKNIEIYIDSGYPGDNYEVGRSMRDLLAKKGYVFGKDLLYFAFPNAEHDETYWATRSHIPFQFFFGKIPDFSGL